MDSFLTYPESAGMGLCDPCCVVQNMLYSYHQENFCDNSIENNDKDQGPDCQVQIATVHHITGSCWILVIVEGGCLSRLENGAVSLEAK
jgi:hypothetical protein